MGRPVAASLIFIIYFYFAQLLFGAVTVLRPAAQSRNVFSFAISVPRRARDLAPAAQSTFMLPPRACEQRGTKPRARIGERTH